MIVMKIIWSNYACGWGPGSFLSTYIPPPVPRIWDELSKFSSTIAWKVLKVAKAEFSAGSQILGTPTGSW